MILSLNLMLTINHSIRNGLHKRRERWWMYQLPHWYFPWSFGVTLLLGWVSILHSPSLNSEHFIWFQYSLYGDIKRTPRTFKRCRTPRTFKSNHRTFTERNNRISIFKTTNLLSSLENGFVLKILGKKVFNGREAKTRSKCTNTTYLLLCNLAIADLGNLLIPTPFNAFTLLYGRYDFSKVRKLIYWTIN